MPNYLAVYGSLRPAVQDRAAPSIRGAHYRGPCLILGRLFVTYGYPALKHGPGLVHGDLFELPYGYDFRPLDGFEAYCPLRPDWCWYHRRLVRLHEPRVLAWVYYSVHPCDQRTLIASGDWAKADRKLATRHR